jgi:glycosyltransferase involved in cell wall biosynthesis
MVLNNKHPVRILHVVGGMVQGGIETWLMHVLRHINRDRFQMDFLVQTDRPCAYDREILNLGSKIVSCPHVSQPWLYARDFKRVMRENGPYDIVHSHVHHFSGYVLWLAKQAGIPVRIAHSHNDTSSIEAKARWPRYLYLSLMQWWINRYSTVGLGCSRDAVADLFGETWENDPRYQVLYYGIDLSLFHNPIDLVSVRDEFSIPKDAFVIGHVGRFVEQKNHKFLLEIVAEVAKKDPKMYLLLVGEGILRTEIEQQARQIGLADRVIFAGTRSDISRLMLGAMDLFLFPSLHEGLGLVLLEAQAAGMPCVISDVVPEEANAIDSLVQRLSLTQSKSEWAEVVLAKRDRGSAIAQSDALSLVRASPFNIEKSVKQLENIYQAEVV